MPLTIEDILADLDIPAIKATVRGTFMGKYGVSLRHGASEALAWSRAFRLEECESCKVLDIACGIGMFARVCNKLGHDATGLDQPTKRSISMNSAKLMGVRFIEHKVMAADPLPDFPPETFDVVTMMHISTKEGVNVFYKALAGEVWDALRPGGCWWVVFHDVNGHLTKLPQWTEWFPGTIAQRGSRVIRLEKPL